MKPMNVKVRWMVRGDLAEVLEIERLSFEFQWSEQDFINALRHRSRIGIVAVEDGTDLIRGYAVYELGKSKLTLLNMAVEPCVRGRGVGSVMLEKIIDKLSPERRTRLICDVRETNLDTQLWLRNRGFKATEIIRGHYEDTDEDAYRFVYRAKVESKVTA